MRFSFAELVLQPSSPRVKPKNDDAGGHHREVHDRDRDLRPHSFVEEPVAGWNRRNPKLPRTGQEGDPCPSQEERTDCADESVVAVAVAAAAVAAAAAVVAVEGHLLVHLAAAEPTAGTGRR